MFLRHRKHCLPIIKSNCIILFAEIISVIVRMTLERMNKILNVKVGGTYTNNSALKGLNPS
jgi:hypothetical protein